jgi:hypothetical protein
MGCGNVKPEQPQQNISIVPGGAVDNAPTGEKPPTAVVETATASTDPREKTAGDEDSTTTAALIGVQKAAKPPEEGAKEKLEDRKTKREEERSNMKKQMQKDRSRFKQGLPTSPIANDAKREAEIASFEEAKTPPAATTEEIPTDPSGNENSVVSKEEGLKVTDYS